MTTQNDIKYSVVQFLELPYENIEQYVCVPHSWITSRRLIDRKVFVAYPREDPKLTMKRVKEREPFGEDWVHYLAILKYDTDNYYDADSWVSSSVCHKPFEDLSATSNDNELKIIAKTKIYSSPEQYFSNAKYTKPLMKVVPLNNKQKSTIQQSHQQLTSLDLRKTKTSQPRNEEKTNFAAEVKNHLDLTFGNPAQNLLLLDHIASSQNNMDRTGPDTQHTLSISSRHCQSSKSLHEKCETGHPDVIIQNCNKKETVYEKATKVNHTDKNLPYPQSSQEKPSAMQALLDLISRQSRLPSRIHASSSTLVNESPSPQKRRRDETDNHIQVKYIYEENTYRDDKQIIPSTSLNLLKEIRNVPACSHQKSETKPKTHLKDVIIKKKMNTGDHITNAIECTYINKSVPSESTVKNIPTFLQNVSNTENQVSQVSNEKQQPPAYNVIVQQDSNVNKIIITRSDKNQFNNQTVPSQNIITNTVTSQNSENVINQPCHKSKLKEKHQPNPKTSLKQDSIPPNILLDEYMRQNGSNHLNYSQSKGNVRQPAPQYILNSAATPRLSQSFSKRYYAPPQSTYSQNLLYDPNTFPGLHNREMVLNRELGYQSVTNNAYIQKCANRTPHPSPREEEKQLKPIVQGYLMQDPRTGAFFLSKSTKGDSYDQQYCIKDGINNIDFFEQNIQSFEKQAYPNLAHENHMQPVNTLHSIQNSYKTELFGHSRHNSHQPIHHHNSKNSLCAVENSQKVKKQSCHYKSSYEVKSLLTAPDYPHQDIHMQKIRVERPSDETYIKPSIYSENTKVKRVSDILNSSKISNNLSYLTPKKSIKERLSPIPTNCLLHKLSTQEKRISESVDQSCIKKNILHERNSEDRPDIIPTTPNNSTNKQFPPIYSDTSDESSDESLKEISVKKPNDTNNMELFATHIISSEEKLIANQDNSNESSKLANDRAQTEKILLNDFTHFFNKMDSSFSELSTMYQNVQDPFVECTKTFKIVMKKINEYCNIRIKGAAEQVSPGSHKAVGQNNKPIENESKKYKYGNKEEDDADDDNYKVPIKKRDLKRSFYLPPEYNPGDSRWTLKHKEASSETVELVPQSRVYVDAVQLAHCKQTAKDCKMLARMLLVEIFTHNALSVCSLTGARAKIFDPDETDVRPGLDDHARMVLLMFIKEHGRRNGWAVCDTNSILSSIRNKIQEFRFKRNNYIK